jgi:outer membrane protein FlgP
MKYLIIIIFASMVITACKPVLISVAPQPQPIKKEPKIIEATGYSALSNFKNHSISQKKLLAMRAAKLDAYRNLAEEVYGVKIKSNTTVKEMLIENDSYRAYVDTVIRGAHLLTITPKADGIYEAIVSLTLMPNITSCLHNLQSNCSTSSYGSYNTPGYSYPPINAGYYDCLPDCQSEGINQSSYYAY